MRYRDLDLNLLVVLDALLAEQSVSHAARRLNVTQPAISNSLSRLRRHFDDELLVKLGRRMAPTSLAERIQRPIRDLLLQAQTIADMRPTFDPASAQRTVKLISSDYVMATLLASATRRLAAEAPGMTIVSLPLSERNLEQFDRGDADLLIAPDTLILPGHPSRALFEDAFTCIAWSENAAVGNTLTLRSYLAQTHIVAAFEDARMMSFDETYLKGAGHHRRIGAFVPSFALMPQFVIGTNHIATIQSRLARQLMRSYPLKIVRPRIPFPPITETMQWHPHKGADPASIWFRDLLADVAASL